MVMAKTVKPRKRPQYTSGLSQIERREKLFAKTQVWLGLICNDGYTLQQVADIEGVEREYIRKHLASNKVYKAEMEKRKKEKFINSHANQKEETKEFIIQLMEEGFDDEAIAKSLGMSERQVNNVLIKAGVRVKKNVKKRKRRNKKEKLASA